MNVFARKEIHYNTSSLCARKYLRKYLQIGRKAGTKKPGRFVKLMHLLRNCCRNNWWCVFLFSAPFATRLLCHCHTASTGIEVFHICHFMMINDKCRGYRIQSRLSKIQLVDKTAKFFKKIRFYVETHPRSYVKEGHRSRCSFDKW